MACDSLRMWLQKSTNSVAEPITTDKHKTFSERCSDLVRNFEAAIHRIGSNSQSIESAILSKLQEGLGLLYYNLDDYENAVKCFNAALHSRSRVNNLGFV